jgi:hypothetical protein
MSIVRLSAPCVKQEVPALCLIDNAQAALPIRTSRFFDT